MVKLLVSALLTLITASAVAGNMTPAVNPVYINLGDFDYAA